MDRLLTIRDLHTHFFLDEGTVRAVDGVDLDIPPRTTVGLVGESGCGKSVTALSILQLVRPPGRVVGGRVMLHRDGEAVELTKLDPHSRAIRQVRGNDIAMIFQEPMTSLNPVYTVGDQIAEAVRLHQRLDRRRAWARAEEMLVRVGIPGPRQRAREYPHQLSGGMRQRAMIAMALSCSPALLIADEPTTALDVTIQAQVLDLMRDLQEQMGMAILLITHDLGVIADMAETVVVMYAGRVVERGPADAIFYEPLHPYTQGLLTSIPVLGKRVGQRLRSIPGTVPHALVLPRGCAFQPRCDRRMAACGHMPRLEEIAPGHWVRCWLHTKSG
ncbi:MAG: ABC transporter ATP-binding protein [Candidatus Brocadiia bacterium]